MKVRKSKQELEEIKKYKEEESKLNNQIGSEKLNIQKEHIILVFAIVILIVLITILLYMIFFSKNKNAIVPDAPKYDKLDIGVIDYDDKNNDSSSIQAKEPNNLSVNYTIVSDYYKKGILLSDTQVDLIKDVFVVTSGKTSQDAFISTLSMDGKLNWITKLNDKEFGDFKLYKTIELNDHYYLFGLYEKGNKSKLSVIQVNKVGKIVTRRTISDENTSKVKNVLVYENNKIAIITEDVNDIKVYFTNAKLEENKKVVSSKEYISADKAYYETSTIVDDTIKIAVEVFNTHYIMNVNINSYETSAGEFEAVNNLDTDKIKKVSGYLKGFIAYTNDTVYKFGLDNQLTNKYDYSQVKLEDTKEYLEKYKDDEFIDVTLSKNSIYINTVKTDLDTITIHTSTMFSNIYDTYDLNLKIKKRIVLDTFKYSYDEGILLNSFNKDGIIYEVYSYGVETPSIMISKIG